MWLLKMTQVDSRRRGGSYEVRPRRIQEAIPWQWQIQDFPEEGVPIPKGAPTYYLAIFFPKKCIKMKKIGPEGARVPRSPLDLPLLGTKISLIL